MLRLRKPRCNKQKTALPQVPPAQAAMKIVVLGAGAWGTALAVNACQRHAVQLVTRTAQQAADLRLRAENAAYLPGIAMPDALHVTHELPGFTLLGAVDLLIVAAPIAGLRASLARISECKLPVVWLCKGFESPVSEPFGLLAHEVAAQAAPDLIAGVLSGPSFALEVAQSQPTALVAASAHARVRDALVQAFHHDNLRVYANDDVVGVEVGGAVKNVLAIATGLCDGLNLGLNARAALITRGLTEMTRLGVALGGRAETFMGLSGLGDLVLTATGNLSRNRQVGLLLAQGHSVQQALDSLGHVAEGVYCARTVVQRAQLLGVDMPIAQAVVALLDGHMSAELAVASLMGRGARTED
jgi:glycerol-3-phosphate dehydrogenase (NAD(P)+)